VTRGTVESAGVGRGEHPARDGPGVRGPRRRGSGADPGDLDGARDHVTRTNGSEEPEVELEEDRTRAGELLRDDGVQIELVTPPCTMISPNGDAAATASS
jgi:hypothetical protein